MPRFIELPAKADEQKTFINSDFVSQVTLSQEDKVFDVWIWVSFDNTVEVKLRGINIPFETEELAKDFIEKNFIIFNS